MNDNYCVNIEGDRTNFKSKNAIKRFKNDLKKSKNKDFKLEFNNYFKDGFGYTSELNDYSISVKIVQTKLDEKINKKEMNRKRLREKIRNMRGIRSSQGHKQVKELKKNIPRNVLKSYMDLNRTFDVPVPKPDEVLSNPSKYKELIKAYASRLKLTEDPKMNNMLNKYFKSLAKSLNIDVKDGEFSAQQIHDIVNENEGDEKTDSETDSETESDKMIKN